MMVLTCWRLCFPRCAGGNKGLKESSEWALGEACLPKMQIPMIPTASKIISLDRRPPVLPAIPRRVLKAVVVVGRIILSFSPSPSPACIYKIWQMDRVNFTLQPRLYPLHSSPGVR